jgi:hypothetical protein
MNPIELIFPAVFGLVAGIALLPSRSHRIILKITVYLVLVLSALWPWFMLLVLWFGLS